MISNDRLIRMPAVEERTGLHRATIYRRIAKGRFPAGVAIGENSSGWYESEISEWIADPMGWRPHQAAA